MSHFIPVELILWMPKHAVSSNTGALVSTTSSLNRLFKVVNV